MSTQICRAWLVAVLTLAVVVSAHAQSVYPGTLQAFEEVSVEGVVDVLANEVEAHSDAVAGVMGWGIRTVNSASDLLDAYAALDGDDGKYDPLGIDDGFQAPSACADNEECGACYRRAKERIDFNRYYLHRAWSITTQYARYAEGAMAFGDSSSGIHGVTGLSWQLQGKPPIQQSLKKLRTTYRDKYRSYTDSLESAMKELGECESKHGGDERWYGRYAALYIDLIKTRYRIED